VSEANLLLVLVGIALFALFSGPISRGSLTPPMVFVFLGLILSPVGFGWIDLTVDNKVVHIIAEVTLILVLFTDAARINLKSLWSDHDIPVRLLFVGMPLTILAGVLCHGRIARAADYRGTGSGDHPRTDGCRTGAGRGE
jgi:NhaP-type Na+/H+ or K+/H+ antiporter